MRLRRLLALSVVLGTCLAGGHPAARTMAVTQLLDRYYAGQFVAVVGALEEAPDFDDILNQLRRDGPAWIDAAGPGGRAKRELAAATFALEAARAGEWHEWKVLQRQPNHCPDTDCRPKSVLYWKAPPLLLEWGCALLRAREAPLPGERWWQLAALAVAQRSEDPQFLIGDPFIGRRSMETGNTQDEIKHLDHVMPRFPKDMRFVLAQGIARDRYLPDDAVQAYRALEHDPDVGGEAMMRLGAMHLRGRSFLITPGTPPRVPRNQAEALRSLARAEELTRDPYVVFLARYFRGQALEREGRAGDAEQAYRGAVAAVPNAQSATIALAALVFRHGRRGEALTLVSDMLAADPRPLDPWRAYVHADDRFWPELVARLRAEFTR
jgi:hypothetical protein